MGVGHAYAIALQGAEGKVVTVECDVCRGLPGISVVGMGDAAVVQAKDRIRSALRNTGVQWPGSRTVMSLSPAAMPKSGSGYDVAMVCAMLLASGATGVTEAVRERVHSAVLVGELGLDGSVRPVPGIFPRVAAAAAHGFRHVVVPEACAEEARRAVELLDDEPSPGPKTGRAEQPGQLGYPGQPMVHLASHLGQVLDWMHGGQLPRPVTGQALPPGDVPGNISDVSDMSDMSDVVGQSEAVRAVEVAAAGGHNLMLTGPPGSGKSMLAERLPGILPPMTRREQREAAVVHSIAGTKGDLSAIWRGTRPFIAPHHSITHAAMIGGGAIPVPGAVSLAHHGVLFVDEVAEARRDVLDSLRTPLEKRQVEIIRQRQIMTFPAQFQLVLAANPCPCGAELASECRCPSGARRRYQAKISGPLRDRIDVFARTRSVSKSASASSRAEPSSIIAERVCAARDRALQRWARVSRELGGERDFLNSTIPSTILRDDFAPDGNGTTALEGLVMSRELSQRGADRALRVAWTLADLAGADRPGLDHVLDAVDLFRDGTELD